MGEERFCSSNMGEESDIVWVRKRSVPVIWVKNHSMAEEK